MPNADYEVYLSPFDGAGPVGTFTTNAKGQGHLHAEVDGNRSGADVAVKIPGDGTVLLGEQ
jgi:hypothetical protein